jgi:hypothetical protein
LFSRVPAADWEGIEAVLLRQPRRKEQTLASAWGRLSYAATRLDTGWIFLRRLSALPRRMRPVTIRPCWTDIIADRREKRSSSPTLTPSECAARSSRLS